MFLGLVATTLFSVSGFASDNKDLNISRKQVKFDQVNLVGFCGVRVVTSYVNDAGEVTGTTEEFVWLGISTNAADCQRMIRAYADSIGGTIH